MRGIAAFVSSRGQTPRIACDHGGVPEGAVFPLLAVSGRVLEVRITSRG